MIFASHICFKGYVFFFGFISTVTIYAIILNPRLESQALGKLRFRQLRVSHSSLRVGDTPTFWHLGDLPATRRCN